MTDTAILIPLANLQLSELNERRDVSDADTETLATSLATTGLLQNLVGLTMTAAKQTHIVDGGRRLRALQWLADRNWTLPDGTTCAAIDPVPVLVTDDADTAVVWAGTANTARTPLHPADEVGSYAAMAKRQKDVPSIARAFAVTERHVQRRLKLARLPEPVLTALRADEISLDMATALTYAKTPEACLRALNTAVSTNIGARNIKHDLTQGAVRSTDRRALYIGLDAYIDAGGEADEDLFDDGAWLNDVELLNTLFMAKLSAAAEQMRIDGGWSWAIPWADSYTNYSETSKFQIVDQTQIDLPEADQRELEDLSTRSETEELTEIELARLDELDNRTSDWTQTDRATSGIFVLVNEKGDISTSFRAYRRPADFASSGEGDDDDDDNGKGSDGTVTKIPTNPPFPQNLLDDMAAIRLHALQVELAGKMELALDLLAFSIDPACQPWHRPLAFSATFQRNAPQNDDGFRPDSRVVIPPLGAAHTNPAEAFQQLRELGKVHRNQVLTHHLAATLATRSDRDPITHILVQLLNPDVRRHWHPTASFFKRADVAWLDSIYIELTSASDENAAAFRQRTKKDKVKALDDLFNNMSTREALGLSRAQNTTIDAWLPPPLRFDKGEV